jgi:hypothetical protein
MSSFLEHYMARETLQMTLSEGNLVRGRQEGQSQKSRPEDGAEVRHQKMLCCWL